MTTPAHTPETLLPCPFCNGTALEVILYNSPCVICNDCDANGPGAQRLEVDVDNRSEASIEARQLWNRRAIPAPEAALRLAVEALTEALAYITTVPSGQWIDHKLCLLPRIDSALAQLATLTPKEPKENA